MGATTNAFQTAMAANNPARFNCLNREASSVASTRFNPGVGKTLMKVPTAKASAMLCGEALVCTSSWQRSFKTLGS